MVDAKFYEEFGELKGKVDGMSTQLTDVKSEVGKISEKLDRLSAVPMSAYNDHLKTASEQYKTLLARADENKAAIDTINRRLELDDNSLSGRLSIFFNNAAVKIIGGGVITLVVVAIGLSYLNQINDMRKMIESLHTTDVQIKSELDNKK